MKHAQHKEPLVKIASKRNGYSVSHHVNTRSYHEAFEHIPVSSAVSQSAYIQAGRILQRADGQDKEYMAAIDAKTGRLIVDNLSRDGTARNTYFNDEEMLFIDAHQGKIITIHNHPHNGAPSFGDVMTASCNQKITGSIIIGHDGSMWFISANSSEIATKLEKAYNTVKDEAGECAEIIALDWLINRSRKERFVWMKLR